MRAEKKVTHYLMVECLNVTRVTDQWCRGGAREGRGRERERERERESREVRKMEEGRLVFIVEKTECSHAQ